MWERLDPDDPRRGAQRAARALTLGAVALFWCVATDWRPWRLLHRGGFSSDFYDEQARAFLHGRLHVDPAVASIEGFVVDGRTYLYYGPFLAIARLPTALVDRLADARWLDGRLALVSMLLALVVLATWTYRLVGVAGDVVAGNVPATAVRHVGTWRTALFVGAVVGSPVLALAGWISVYHETELWACAFAVIAATAMLRAMQAADAVDSSDAREVNRHLAVAATATVAAVLTRASIGIGVSMALVAVAVVLVGRHRRAAIAAAVAAGAGVAVHMALNTARFGSLLGLPADRQVLSLQDPVRAAWFAERGGSFFGIDFLPTTLLQYLRPDAVRFERLVPGVRYGPLARDIGPSPVESITPASSLTAAAPVLVVLAVFGVVWLVGRRRWAVLAVVGGLVVGAVPSFTIGFIANRYLVDMLPALIVPAAVGLWVLRVPSGLDGGRGRVAVRAVVVVAVVWGLWANASFATWTLGLKSTGFTELRYRVDAAVFPAPSPGLVVFDPVSPVPRDGVVAVDAECRGVYIAEQGRWVALERGDGRRTVAGRVAPIDETRPLVDAGRWELWLLEPGDAAVVELVVEGASVAALPAGRLGVGDEVSVVADPVTGELSVRGPDSLVLFDPTVPRVDDELAAPALERRARDPELCELLRPRT